MLNGQNGSSQIPERQKLQLIYERYRPQYETTLRKTYRSLRKLLIRADTNFNIKYRIKSFDSYFAKLIRIRNSSGESNQINDLFGLRIICPFLEDLERIEKQISEKFTVLEVERKGEKNSFREFSYDSIHLLIENPDPDLANTLPNSGKVCEIQLRTILQDAWAEVEHELIYKANFSLLNGSIKRKLASLNASLTLSDIIFQEIRDYQKEIDQRRERCRDSLQEKIHLDGGISIMDTVKNPLIQDTKNKAYSPPIKPNSPLERQIFEALDAHSNNELDKAIKIYSQILRLKLKPHVRSIIYNHRGMAWFVKSKYDRSIRDFSQAIKNNGKSRRAFNNRGLAYRMLHQYENALKDFNTSLNSDPYQHETYHIRALTFHDLNDFMRAIEDCKKSLEIKPDFEPALYLKNVIAAKLGY